MGFFSKGSSHYSGPQDLSDTECTQLLERYADGPNVHGVRIVEFAGVRHLHIDLNNGDIGVVGKDERGEMKYSHVEMGHENYSYDYEEEEPVVGVAAEVDESVARPWWKFW